MGMTLASHVDARNGATFEHDELGGIERPRCSRSRIGQQRCRDRSVRRGGGRALRV